jgi:hypothetical protein
MGDPAVQAQPEYPPAVFTQSPSLKAQFLQFSEVTEMDPRLWDGVSTEEQALSMLFTSATTMAHDVQKQQALAGLSQRNISMLETQVHMQAYMYSLCHALDVQISLSPTVSVRATAAAAATIAAPVTLRSEKRVRMCVNTLRRTKSWKRMLTQSGTQQRCARPRGVCRPKQQCNEPSATDM